MKAPDAAVDRADAARSGVQSVEMAGRVLQAFARHSGSIGLSDVAKDAGIAPSKAHRYLTSLTRSGMVEQDSASGRYMLGPQALHLGLAALSQIDVVRLAGPIVDDLRDRLGETVGLSIWTDRGPTIVLWAQALKPVAVYARPGLVLPLLRSATGHVFLTYQRQQLVAPALAAEREALPAAQRSAWSEERIGRVRDDVRQLGVGIVVGELMAGVSAIAVPVFNHRGDLAAAINVLGYQNVFETRPSGVLVQTTVAAGRQLSYRLGHAP